MRRVVTGRNAAGKSVIAMDSTSPHALELPGMPGLVLTNLWVTDGSPADNSGSADASARPVVLEPPAGGSIFRVVDFPPDKDLLGKMDRGKAFEAMGAHGAMDRDASRHPGMHKTRTVGADGRGRALARGRRLPDPARHQPRLGQPQRPPLPRRLHPDRRPPAVIERRMPARSTGAARSGSRA
jgi:hypothetical protein